jgi:hypothetical protein
MDKDGKRLRERKESGRRYVNRIRSCEYQTEQEHGSYSRWVVRKEQESYLSSGTTVTATCLEDVKSSQR